MRRAAILRLAIAIAALLAIASCTRDERFAAGRDRFLANRLDEALPLFEAAVRTAPDAERHAWLADTYRRLARLDDAAASARRSLELDPCQPFAHQVLADLHNPLYSGWEHVDGDSTWAHARAAVACDPAFASAWLVVWLQGLLRGERAEEDRALRELAERRFFTPAALAFGRWLLATAPERVVLVTNGDMDTYPLHVLQAGEGLRPDVAIVNLSLLNAGPYRRAMRERHGLPIADSLLANDAQPVPGADGSLEFVGDRVVAAWAEAAALGTLGRPLAISTTVASLPVARSRLVLDGPRWIVVSGSAAAPVDTTAIRTNLFALKAADFTGRWVTDADLSPIRRVHSRGLAHNLMSAADRYAETVGRTSGEAAAMQVWAVGFARDARFDATATSAAECLTDTTSRATPDHR